MLTLQRKWCHRGFIVDSSKCQIIFRVHARSFFDWWWQWIFQWNARFAIFFPKYKKCCHWSFIEMHGYENFFDTSMKLGWWLLVAICKWALGSLEGKILRDKNKSDIGSTSFIKSDRPKRMTKNWRSCLHRAKKSFYLAYGFSTKIMSILFTN